MRKLVLDIETRNTFAEVGGREPGLLDLSLLVVYDYDKKLFTSYLEEDLPRLWPLLESADLIIGFNSDYFDIPILNKYYTGDLSRIRSLDLLSEVKKSLGKRISLDMIAAGTLGREKSSHGLQAVEWWKEGKIEEIRAYCQEDVRITRDIFDYALANGKLKYKMVNEIREFAVDSAGWEKPAAAGFNYTLPF